MMEGVKLVMVPQNELLRDETADLGNFQEHNNLVGYCCGHVYLVIAIQLVM